MKKSIVIISIVLLLLVTVAAGFTAFSLMNKEKDSITAEEFKTIMQDKGYLIADATSQFSEYDYVSKVYLATTSDKLYQIEFYTLSDDSSATYFFNTNKTLFEQNKTSVSTSTSSEFSNHAKYTLTSNNEYMVVSRINNTVVYANVDEQHKDAVKDILKELGY